MITNDSAYYTVYHDDICMVNHDLPLRHECGCDSRIPFLSLLIRHLQEKRGEEKRREVWSKVEEEREE